MRLFVALEIPATVRDNLATLIKELRNAEPKARWVRAENLHVTLKFLGETPSEKLEDIQNALSAVHSEQPVELDFRGLGFFPNEIRPRVLWAGMHASPNVQSLAASMDQALEKLARESGRVKTNEFHIVESKLKPSGAEYTRLASFPFAAAEN